MPRNINWNIMQLTVLSGILHKKKDIKLPSMTVIHILLAFALTFIVHGTMGTAPGGNYEVADIDCAIGTGGKELLTARLRRPDGFRGTPIFADDRGSVERSSNSIISSASTTLLPLPSHVMTSASLTAPENSLASMMDEDDMPPCQIVPDTMADSSGRVFKLRITDFSQCGVMKRNGFIHVRVWFPQLPGVVMLSDQEVIIMCKPPAATVVQSKTAGFAGSIPSGARISGIVEESPGRLEYEVALYRETSTPLAGRSSAGAYITGADSHELPVDQAVPIGTRLQLRAKINSDSAWKHAKLMEVSVSPDPKNPDADGSVALVRDGCRNPDLVSIIPKQPYRYKERTNEVVLDFEAFLLSNMADRSTLWLHTQIKACMESQDCHPEFCMDVYQPSGYGKKRRRRRVAETYTASSPSSSNVTAMEYSSPLSRHWTAYADEIILDNEPTVVVEELKNETSPSSPQISSLDQLLKSVIAQRDPTTVDPPTTKLRSSTGTILVGSASKSTSSSVVTTPTAPSNGNGSKPGGSSTKFGENIGFSVIMPSDYYRSTHGFSASYECRGWATATMGSLFGVLVALLLVCAMAYRMKGSQNKEKYLYPPPQLSPRPPIHIVRSNTPKSCSSPTSSSSGSVSSTQAALFHHPHHQYARDASIYRS